MRCCKHVPLKKCFLTSLKEQVKDRQFRIHRQNLMALHNIDRLHASDALFGLSKWYNAFVEPYLFTRYSFDEERK